VIAAANAKREAATNGQIGAPSPVATDQVSNPAQKAAAVAGSHHDLTR
jgi:hypothetical protein